MFSIFLGSRAVHGGQGARRSLVQVLERACLLRRHVRTPNGDPEVRDMRRGHWRVGAQSAALAARCRLGTGARTITEKSDNLSPRWLTWWVSGVLLLFLLSIFLQGLENNTEYSQASQFKDNSEPGYGLRAAAEENNVFDTVCDSTLTLSLCVLLFY